MYSTNSLLQYLPTAVELTGCSTDLSQQPTSNYGFDPSCGYVSNVTYAPAAVAKPAPLDASDTDQAAMQVLLRYGTAAYPDCMTNIPAVGTRDWKVSPHPGMTSFLGCPCPSCLSVDFFLADPRRERLTVKGSNATLKGQ
jgi:hypothetical protein